MGKYIKYKRMSMIINPEELDKTLNKIVSDGFEIIHYNENILEVYEGIERINVVIVCGKLNEGKQIL